jgi:alkylation response protein AidB-like acyl-CoA dehydrogenase
MLTDQEHEQLRGLVREFLTDRSPESAVRAAMDTDRGFDPQLWAGLGTGGIGVCGLAVPTRWGGEGQSIVEVVVVLAELGRSLACVPYLSSVLFGQSVLLAAGDDAAAGRWLPLLATGEARAAVAVIEAPGRWEVDAMSTVAVQDGAGWRVSGTKEFVVDGHTADVLFVAARSAAGVGLFEVAADAEGLVRTPVPTLDLTRKQARLALTDTPGKLVGPSGGGWNVITRLLRLASVGLAAESVGGMRRVLEMSVAHAGTRTQFGRPIGGFQAIKHKCADMLLAVESADSIVRDVARAAAVDDDDEFPVVASLAHAYTQEAYLDCAAENIQVHGGIGFTWEHSAQLYYKRAQSSRLLLGDPIFHRALAADLIGLC